MPVEMRRASSTSTSTRRSSGFGGAFAPTTFADDLLDERPERVAAGALPEPAPGRVPALDARKLNGRFRHRTTLRTKADAHVTASRRNRVVVDEAPTACGGSCRDRCGGRLRGALLREGIDVERRACRVRRAAALRPCLGAHPQERAPRAALRPGAAHDGRDGEHRGRRGRRRPAGAARAERQLRDRRRPPAPHLPGRPGSQVTVLTRNGPGPLGETPIELPELERIVNGGATARSSSPSTRASGSACASTPSARSTSSTAPRPEQRKSGPAAVGAACFRGGTTGECSRAPAASGPRGGVPSVEHSAAASTLDSSPFRWFSRPLHRSGGSAPAASVAP